MILNRNLEKINERCEKLESLGFKCNNLDCVVEHPDYKGITFDFSAINIDDVSCVMYHTIATAFDSGKVQAILEYKQKLQEIIL